MRRKVAIVLSAAMMAAAFSVSAAAAQGGGASDSTLNHLNVIIEPIDGNYSSTDFIQAIFTPDSGPEALKAQSCSGKVAAANFLFVPSGTVTFNKSGYHTEPASWHVDADNFDGQTLQFTLIPDNYTGDLRAAAKPEVTITKTDMDENRNFIKPQDLLTFSSSTPDAVIRYTTDGSEPTYESARYTRPIYLEGDVTFKAIATKSGYVKSPVMEYHYKAETPAERPKMKTARISGSIVDEAGVPIPYVRVTYTFAVPTSATGIVTAAEENGEFFVDVRDRDVGTLKFSKEGYTFEEVKITESYEGSVITVIGKSKTAPKETEAPETEAPETEAPETEAPETEAPPETEVSKNTVTLYFMTGSSPDEPGEVFAQYEVPKNSRGNTTTIAKTIGSRKPKKDGYTFSHWQEGKLSDSSVLGNKVSGVIWTNETDQHIYAQYKAGSK